MYVVMGATGNVGGAVADALLDAGEQVIALVHDAAKGEPLRQRGAAIVAVDVGDVDALRAAFRRGRRAFLLNPPADVSGDTDAAELRSGRAIAAALAGSGLEKVVVASTYGARAGQGIGDLSTLFAFEQATAASGIPAAINRGAYYLSNLAMLLEPARNGALPTMFPAALRLPMVAPEDLGRAAARRLCNATTDVGVCHIEGPARHSFAEVAAAFAEALGRDVTVQPIPPERWHDAYRELGFSDAAADAYGRMTQVTVDDAATLPKPDERGTITLERYVADLVAGQRTA